MLQAMNTGHDGSMTTVHANSPRDAIRRIETMILMGTNISFRAMREQISSSINVMIHLARLSDGSRKVLKLTEITGMEGDIVSMQDIFVYKKFGVREDGKVIGEIHPTGIRPKFADVLTTSGIQLDPEMFEENGKEKK
jgi:pilus assembly protein CpaF